jgi:hypothetical protein
MIISFWNILAPVGCLKTYALRNKRKNYENLKNYIINKLCIKQLLVRMNEVEKLKHFTLKEELREFFQDPNPFPNSQNVTSVWENNLNR